MHDSTDARHGLPKGGVRHLLLLPPSGLRILLATWDRSGHSCEVPKPLPLRPRRGLPGD
jgi:hypothetical protein